MVGMKSSYLLLLCLCCTVAAQVQNRPTFRSRKAEPPLAVVDVQVIPMTRAGVLQNQTVIIEQGRITRIGPTASVRLPRRAQRIDGRGKYLMPGLTDFHVHLREPSELLAYLAHGVTTVVHLSGPLLNIPDVLALRRRINAGEALGPNLYASGRILDGQPPIFPNVSTVVTTAAEAERAVTEQQQAGVDFIKVYNNLEPEVLQAVVAAARQRGLAVVGHIPRKAGRAQALQTALAAGQTMIAHAEELFFTYFYAETDSLLAQGRAPQPDLSRLPQVVQWLREAKVFVTPDLVFTALQLRQLEQPEAIFAEPEARLTHPAILNMWRQQSPGRRADRDRFELRERAKYAFLQELTRALLQGGVPLLLGTDASTAGLLPGKSAHWELQELVRAGLTPWQALATGTNNPGRFVQRHVRGATAFGTVARGQRADLLLLEANPLADIHHLERIAGIVVRGRWFAKEELASLRRSAARAFPNQER